MRLYALHIVQNTRTSIKEGVNTFTYTHTQNEYTTNNILGLRC